MNLKESFVYKNASLILPRILLVLSLYIIYCIIRDIRETVVLSANSAGAEVIPFLKFWAMLPSAIIITGLFTRLSRRFNSEKATYIIMGSFLAYFFCFAFFIFPNLEAWCFLDLSERMMNYLPSGFAGMVNMICNWPISVFYVLSGLWATIVVALLFWGIINQVSTPEHASSSYGILKIGGTLSASVAGVLATLLRQDTFTELLPFGKTAWEQTLMKETLFVMLLGCLSFYLFRMIYNSANAAVDANGGNKKNLEFSLRKSIRYILQSRYLTCMAILVFGFTFIYDLSDVLWKAQIRKAFDNPNEIMGYLNKITFILGLISLAATIISPWIISRFGWKTLAIITPITILVSSAGFFIFLLWEGSLNTYSMHLFGMSALSFSVFLGALQSCLGRAAKYSVFDVSKEIAFTPLDLELRWNGKAAIDGLGNDVARVGAASVHQVAIIFFGSIFFSAPFIAALIIGYLLVWLGAVNYIGEQYNKMTGRVDLEVTEEAC
ncbi:ADP,ATP carrier protein 2 [Chlamydiales bacterium SCGC AG-110-M15]|nr:ADP,ATP carrier protein 2 [Chlamydiales bacterium SCGC AG-110-M15]